MALASAVLAALAISASSAVSGCKCGSEPSRASPGAPSLRLYVMSSVAGALEPCGCVKDMLGGADHAAAYIASQAGAAPNALVVGAGPMLFPQCSPRRALVTCRSASKPTPCRRLQGVGLSAGAGANDWLLGESALDALVQRSGATLLGANVKSGKLHAPARRDLGHEGGASGRQFAVGDGRAPTGVEFGDAATAAKSVCRLKGRRLGARYFAGGDAAAKPVLLVEAQPGFEVAVLGKPFDEGEANDPPQSPTLIGKTLVVENAQSPASLGWSTFRARPILRFSDGSGWKPPSASSKSVGACARSGRASSKAARRRISQPFARPSQPAGRARQAAYRKAARARQLLPLSIVG